MQLRHKQPTHSFCSNGSAVTNSLEQKRPLLVMDLLRLCAAPSARLSHLSFEGDQAFPTQCGMPAAGIVKGIDVFAHRHLAALVSKDHCQINSALIVSKKVPTAELS